MNKNIIIGIIVIIVLVLIGVGVTSTSSSTSSNNPVASSTVDMNATGTDMDGTEVATSSESTPSANTTIINSTSTVNVSTTGTANPSVKTFTVTGSNFKFIPSEIKVNKGDTVKIVFKNAEGFHDFKIDEFNVATPRIQGGGEATVQFVANKTGTFEYYCSVGEHRQMGMRGNLIVQ